MFEIMALDQASLVSFYQQVFGWTTTPDSAGFQYVRFPAKSRSLLGGLGSAGPRMGFQKGVAIYFEVPQDQFADKLALILQNGGSQVGVPAHVDGFSFVNFLDPEGNVMGLVAPFHFDSDSHSNANSDSDSNPLSTSTQLPSS